MLLPECFTYLMEAFRWARWSDWQTSAPRNQGEGLCQQYYSTPASPTLPPAPIPQSRRCPSTTTIPTMAPHFNHYPTPTSTQPHIQHHSNSLHKRALKHSSHHTQRTTPVYLYYTSVHHLTTTATTPLPPELLRERGQAHDRAREVSSS